MEAIFTIGNIYFDIFSIIILLVVVIGAIRGAVKGFMYSLIKFLQVFVLFGAGFLLSKPIGDALFNTSIAANFISDLTPKIEGIGEIFAMTLPSENQLEFVEQALIGMKIPSFIADGLAELILNYVQIEGGQSLGAYIAQGLINYACIGIAFVIISIIVGIVILIFKGIAKSINKAPVLGFVNRVLGFVVCAVVTYLICDAIMFGLSIFTLQEAGPGNFIYDTLYIGDDNVFTISKFIATHSIIRTLIEAFL